MEGVVKEINQVKYSCKTYSQTQSKFGTGIKPRSLTIQVHLRHLHVDKTVR